jgi:DNA polymerase-3 subunit alpha
MLDIDLDFQDDRRGEILQYCAEHYGSDKVAQIITFGTLGARAAIRDVGRVMDIPLSEVDRISKAVPAMIPDETVTIHTALEKSPEFKAVYDEGGYVQDLIDTAAEMEGVARNAGTHAAGVVITDVPLLEYLPLHRPTSNAEESPIKSVTQFEMNIITKLGLLKVDFLGLATITVIHKACDLIRERHGIDLDLHNIPLDDPETFEFISKGHTAGLFQLEGNGMTRYIVQMKPRDLSNIIAMVALFRPGPMEFIPQYIRRMHDEEPVTYEHPTMEKVFKETYGLPVYQEQLMMAVMELAGYTPAQADDLRKAISKKIKEKIEKHKLDFIAGAQKNGIEEEKARGIFEGWENFARYGFNKSHAADYGVIAVETAYLKLHYSVEYMTALLSVTKNETAKVASYVADARSMGIEVLPPDVNTSCWDFTIEDLPNGASAIRFGLGAVKNVGSNAVEMILEERKSGKFKDLNDFMRRVNLQKVGRRSLEFMIKVGALDSFGQRTALLEVIDSLISISGSHFRAAECGQMSIFGSVAGMEEEIRLREGTLLDKRQQLEWEKELIGLYVSDHPITPYLPLIRQKATHLSRELPEAPKDQRVTVAGMVTRLRTMNTKKGDQMAFATIEDLQGAIELVIFPRTWVKFGGLVQMESVLLVEGKPDTQSADPKILVDSIKPLQLEDYVQETQSLDSPYETQGLTDPWQGDFDTDYYARQANGDEGVRFATREEPLPAYTPPPEPPLDDPEFTPAETSVPETIPQEEQKTIPVESHISNPVIEEVKKPPAIMPPLNTFSLKGEATSIRMITVTLKASGERDRDVRRIKRVHGILNSFPGRDRFCFMIFERGSRHLLDFPNDTTGVNSELINRLYDLVGRENVQVEFLSI